MDNDYFVIGDVHGCLKTFQKLLSHWNPDSEILVQLGDLIDRGRFSPQTLSYSMELQNQYPGKIMFLRGNHEQLMLDFHDGINTSWLANGGRETLEQFKSSELELSTALSWIRGLPLFFEVDKLFISHAGIAETIKTPIDPHHPNGLLWNREPLKNIGKTQIIGHTPLTSGKPTYTSQSNSWNIDTGAYKGVCLSGIKLKSNGNFLDIISLPTINKDLMI